MTVVAFCFAAADRSLAADNDLRKLGEQSLKGEGLPKDVAKELQLLEAAAANDSQALTSLGRLHLEGTSAKRGVAKAAASGKLGPDSPALYAE